MPYMISTVPLKSSTLTQCQSHCHGLMHSLPHFHLTHAAFVTVNDSKHAVHVVTFLFCREMAKWCLAKSTVIEKVSQCNIL